MLPTKHGDRFHFHPIHFHLPDSEESARILAAALGLAFTIFLATCALYLALHLHDYYGS